MKKLSSSAGRRAPSRKDTTAKATGQRHGTVSSKTVIERLMAKHELSELEASWLLKAWELGGVAKSRKRFACYLAGFMAGIAFKTVEQEVKSRRT